MFRLSASIVALALVAACSQPTSPETGGAEGDDGELRAPSTEDVQSIVKAYLTDNPACTPFFVMPRDLSLDATHERQRMDAFVAAGLLRREGEVSVVDPNVAGDARRMVRYSVTPEGAKFFHAGTGSMADYKSVICYGRYDVDTVKVGTVDPIMRTVSVTFRHRLVDPAPWIEVPAIQTFYPNFRSWREERQGEDLNATLEMRDGKWVVRNPTGPEMYDLRQLSH